MTEIVAILATAVVVSVGLSFAMARAMREMSKSYPPAPPKEKTD